MGNDLYSEIPSCIKQIPSCYIIFLNKVELHFISSKFVNSVQVNVQNDLFVLMFCQYMCFLFNTKALFPKIVLGYPSCSRKKSLVTHISLLENMFIKSL